MEMLAPVERPPRSPQGPTISVSLRETDSERTRTMEKTCPYNTRLQKGGALLGDMRLLVRNWTDESAESQREAMVAQNLLGKDTRTRAAETYRRAYRPRFIEGDPPEAWRIVRWLEDRSLPVEVLRPVYYWITARCERLLYDFVSDELFSRISNHDQTVRTVETCDWIAAQIKPYGRTWSPTVTKKVARGMSAALRDFGILEGAAKKRIAPAYLPIEAFAYIAFTINSQGSSGHALVTHRDWALFLLPEVVVENQFLEADRNDLLSYQAAGRIVRVDFPAQTHEEMADVVAARAH